MHYKSYCRILSNVIKAAKKLQYNSNTINSDNKIKTMWNIVKSETGKRNCKIGVHQMNINGKLITNNHMIANSFNTYFSTIADKLTASNTNNNS
jgi:hypothetical protein